MMREKHTNFINVARFFKKRDGLFAYAFYKMGRGLFSLLLCSLCLMTAQAETILALPVGRYLDSEVTTNCPFKAQLDRSGDFYLSLSCRATPSNNVEVALGPDDNGNGILDLDEIGRVFGWDCGRWFTRQGADGVYVSQLGGAGTDIRELSLELHVGPQGAPRRLLVLADGISVFGDVPLDSVFSPAWNMLRLTGRGADVSLEHFSITVKPYGTTIIIR